MLFDAVYILNLRFMPDSIIYDIKVKFMLNIDAKYYLCRSYIYNAYIWHKSAICAVLC